MYIGQTILYLTYEIYHYILQIIFYQHRKMGLVCAKVHGVSLPLGTSYSKFVNLHLNLHQPSRPFCRQHSRSLLPVITSLLPGMGGGIFPFLPLALEALSTPHYSQSNCS